MSDSSQSDPNALVMQVQDYHQRTKHHFEGYAKGPETLDWDAQPAPFRHFKGVLVVRLPRLSELATDAPLYTALQRPFAQLGQQSPLAPSLESLGAWLQLSLGITAWKGYGPDRWAVRANPSSGNLHPTEAYVLVQGFAGLSDGLYHYEPQQHQLELRAEYSASAVANPQLAVILTSVMWREQWKYGERAFRYCQLDAGHAQGALRYAAAALGWTLAEQTHLGTATLARLTGVDRLEEFPARRHPETEREEAEILLALGLDGHRPTPLDAQELRALADQAQWQGVASSIDPYPMYQWPPVAAVAQASRSEDQPYFDTPALAAELPPQYPDSLPLVGQQAIQQLIIQRRSAQRFDPDYVLSAEGFRVLLARLQPSASVPWDTLSHPPRIALLAFVMNVEGLEPGIYLIPRHPDLWADLQPHLSNQYQPEPVPGFDGLLRLMTAEPLAIKRLSRSAHCHQDIAGGSCLTLGMLARFATTLEQEGPSAYRALYREAGLIGQLLYLEAEAQQIRGTGIGCFFDDPVHTLVGLEGMSWQSLYHFTLGLPIVDSRIETTPAYTDDLSATHDA